MTLQINLPAIETGTILIAAATFCGALVGGLTQFYIRWREEQKDKRNLRAAFRAELKAAEGYVSVDVRSLDQMMKLSSTIPTRIFEENSNRLGILETEEVESLVDYYSRIDGIEAKLGWDQMEVKGFQEDIEPVRDYRWWERPDREDVETTSRADIVERLLEQAEQHVDIHKVFCDREFDVHGIRDVFDRHTIQYVISKQKRSNKDYENIEEITESSVYDSRIEHAWARYEGRSHKVSIIYLPGGDYSLFTVNGWVDEHRAQALAEQYRQRWTIENQYKQLKQHFLPRSSSKDYRIRFFYLTISVIMYNVWRLTNFLLRDKVDADLGESPPVPAGEIVELVGLCLFDPGG